MDSIFNEEISEEFISRIEKLTPESKPKWGKMLVAQLMKWFIRININVQTFL